MSGDADVETLGDRDAPGTPLSSLLARLADEIVTLGREVGLPHIAVSGDIGSPDPVCDGQGRPFAATTFRWMDNGRDYWKDRGFALRSELVDVVRRAYEPFYLDQDGAIGCWRESPALRGITLKEATARFGVTGVITVPVRLPMGVVGAVLWATQAPGFEVRAAYLDSWPRLQWAASRFLALHMELRHAATSLAPLSRREVQCVKWLAQGKTDAEISTILGISLSTVRFHARNAARKLGVGARTQIVSQAAALGYIGSDRPRGAARVAG